MADAETKNTYEDLLQWTKTNAELYGQFVNILEKLHDEHAKIKELLAEVCAQEETRGTEINRRLEFIEKIVNANYLHVSRLAEIAIADLVGERESLDEIRAEIEKRVLKQLDERGIRIEAGGDIGISGDVKEGAK